ncbi:MAG: TonB family protein, partial [Pseudomonadota bacterium]
RADPFALYIARMHRQIHKLWGFGFLEDLNLKPDNNPMNDMSLWTNIEIVVLPDGEVRKATLVRTSGILTYDVAALDTVFAAAPYPPPPRAIKSADGNVYLHWRFHRDQRQCGTFGVDPYILTSPPKKIDKLAFGSFPVNTLSWTTD